MSILRPSLFVATCFGLLSICVACSRTSEPSETIDASTADASRPVVQSEIEWQAFSDAVFTADFAARQDVPFGYEWAPVSQEFRTALNVGFSAVAVGPRALLTSAHALGGRSTLDRRGETIADCDVAPGYPDEEPTADLAICRMREPLDLRYYDIVHLEPRSTRPFSQVKVVGFGCTRSGRSASGRLSYRPEVDVLTWPTTDHGMFLDACLCGGDSGGPVFATFEGRRWVVAVNDEGTCDGITSRQDSCDLDAGTCARVTSTASLGDFIRGWAEDNDVLVCGVQEDDRCGWPIGSS